MDSGLGGHVTSTSLGEPFPLPIQHSQLIDPKKVILSTRLCGVACCLTSLEVVQMRKGTLVAVVKSLSETCLTNKCLRGLS